MIGFTVNELPRIITYKIMHDMFSINRLHNFTYNTNPLEYLEFLCKYLHYASK